MKSAIDQRGFSLLGILFFMLVGTFALTCVLKIAPVYIDANTVRSSIQNSIDKGEYKGMSPSQVKSKIGKYFDVNRVDAIHIKDVKVVREKGMMTIDARYEKRVPFMSNIDVVVKFDQYLFEFQP